MFLDLHEGILQIFVEAQRLPRQRHASWYDARLQPRFSIIYRPGRAAPNPPDRRRKQQYKKTYRRRVDALLRQNRPAYVITPSGFERTTAVDRHRSARAAFDPVVMRATSVATEHRSCPQCGAPMELRVGLRHWMHMTEFGRCERA